MSGRPPTCTVRAAPLCRYWLELAGIGDGPPFQAIDRHRNVKQTRLSAQSVALVLKRAAEAAGLPTRGALG